ALPDDVELALERIGVEAPRAAAHENLPDDRLDFLRALGKPRVVHRNAAPAEQQLALGLDRALDLLDARGTRSRLLRQEHHADAIVPESRQRDPELAARAAQERVRHLQQDAGAVALQRIRAGRAAMRQVLE